MLDFDDNLNILESIIIRAAQVLARAASMIGLKINTDKIIVMLGKKDNINIGSIAFEKDHEPRCNAEQKKKKIIGLGR